MKKRLTDAEFHEAIKGLDVGSQTLEIARGVLINGTPQKEFAASLGLSKGALALARSDPLLLTGIDPSPTLAVRPGRG